jgi:hypothetical protein
MQNRETPSCLAPGHSLWSHYRKRSEGASTAKLHFGVSRSEVQKQLTAGAREMRNREITLC